MYICFIGMTDEFLNGIQQAESNLRKHTVSFGESVTIFNDELSITNF